MINIDIYKMLVYFFFTFKLSHKIKKYLFVLDILWLSETDQQKKSREKTETKKEVVMHSSLNSLITMIKQQSMPIIHVEKKECLTMW